MINFNLSKQERKKLFNLVIGKIENYYNNTKDNPVSPTLDVEEIVNFINESDFEKTITPEVAIENVIKGLSKYTVHTPHPKYFGLFNPRTGFPSILADLITAAFNPQLAAWSHAPFAVEVERYLINEFGKRFGYNSDNIDGVFTTGGAEANLTAILCALNNTFPNFAKDGLFGMKKKPIIYCSVESHHSIDKAAKIVGLGHASVRKIEVKDNLKLNTSKLVSAIEQDLKESNQPIMVIGTAGTTGTGTIDDLMEIRKIADNYNLWFHADAAYGGGAIFNDNLMPNFKGIELSDSITFDAHKWMSVPMATSMFFTSHKDILGKTFRITTEYMPREAQDLEIVEPFTHSIQWSRRFIGLKLYLSLQIFGWKGFEEVVGYQTNIGELLKQKLIESNWTIMNDTPLPVVCFSDSRHKSDKDFAKKILEKIIKSGKSWISVYPINGTDAFRACITNYSTSEKDIEELVEELNYERENYLN